MWESLKGPILKVAGSHQASDSKHAAWRKTPGKQEGSGGHTGGTGTTQDLSPLGDAVVKIRPERKILSTRQLCAQDSLGGNPVYLSAGQSKVLSGSRPRKSSASLAHPGNGGSAPCPQVPMTSETPGGDMEQLHPTQSSLIWWLRGPPSLPAKFPTF